MAKKETNSPKQKPSKNFQLIKQIQGKDQGDIKGEKFLYKSNIQLRDRRVRSYIDENVETKSKKTILPGQTACVNLRKTNMAKNMAAADPLAAAPSKPRSKHGKLPTQAAAKPTVPGQRALTPKPYASGGNNKTQGRNPGLLTVRHIGICLTLIICY